MGGHWEPISFLVQILDFLDLNWLVIGSAPSKKSRSAPEVFRAGHNRDMTDTGNRARKTSGIQGMFNIELICSHGDIHHRRGPSRVSYQNHERNASYGNRHCKSDISILYANSRSLVNKTALLELEIATYRYDIMVFTETHLESTISNSELFPSNYTVFRRDRPYNGLKGGGVLISTRDTVKVFQREDLLCDSELLFVDILVSGNRKVNLGVFYRPPKSVINPLPDLQTALDNVLLTPNADLLLLGDFNMSE